MIIRGPILHQHDIHVDHDGLEKVGGDTRPVNLKFSNVAQLAPKAESYKRSDVGICDFGGVNAPIYIESLASHMIK